VAPSSPFERARLEAGVHLLAGMGLVPAVPERVFQAEGFLAGPDALRGRELVDAMTGDPSGAVVCARGGYGATRILPFVAGHAPSFRPKLFMGFSDVTALHVVMSTAGGLVTFHGPNAVHLPRLDPASLERTRKALFGLDRETTFTWAGLGAVAGGVARGRLVAGNLTMLASLCGTPHAARLDGAILVVEEVAEAPYRIDRLLTQLSQQPGAKGIAGVAFGDLGTAEADREEVERVIRRFAAAARVPVVTGFPAGHGAVNVPVPEGVEAILDADVGLLRVAEDPYGK
jgi:muramoyltetrapeptide carboxypeptidase